MATLKKQLINPENFDRVFKSLCAGSALLVSLLMVGLFVQLLYYALPAIKTFGFKFIISSEWDPVNNIYGALPSISGTLLLRQ